MSISPVKCTMIFRDFQGQTSYLRRHTQKYGLFKYIKRGGPLNTSVFKNKSHFQSKHVSPFMLIETNPTPYIPPISSHYGLTRLLASPSASHFPCCEPADASHTVNPIPQSPPLGHLLDALGRCSPCWILSSHRGGQLHRGRWMTHAPNAFYRRQGGGHGSGDAVEHLDIAALADLKLTTRREGSACSHQPLLSSSNVVGETTRWMVEELSSHRKLDEVQHHLPSLFSSHFHLPHSLLLILVMVKSNCWCKQIQRC